MESLLHRKKKGNIGELAVALECAKKGYSVFKELGDISKTDLIIEIGCDLFKIQVKYVQKNKLGTYVVSTKKSGPNGYTYVYGKKEVDVFGVYCCDDDVLVWVCAKDFIKTSDEGMKYKKGEKSTSNTLVLRPESTPPKNNQKKGVVYLENFSSLEEVVEKIKNKR